MNFYHRMGFAKAIGMLPVFMLRNHFDEVSILLDIFVVVVVQINNVRYYLRRIEDDGLIFFFFRLNLKMD